NDERRGTTIFQHGDRLAADERDGGGGNAGEAERTANRIGSENLGWVGRIHDHDRNRRVERRRGEPIKQSSPVAIGGAEVLDDVRKGELNARQPLDEIATADLATHLQARERWVEDVPVEGGRLALETRTG